MARSSHRYHHIAVLVLCLTALFHSGCDMETEEGRPMSEPGAAQQEMRATAADDAGTTAGQAAAGAATAVQHRQLIYTARLRMRVRNVDAAHDAITGMLGSRAYIAADVRRAYHQRVENEMTIRVERGEFWNLLSSIEQLASFVDEKQVQADDVTDAIADLEQRLGNSRAAEQQYREIMKRATKISDILEVQEHLVRVRGEIEAMEARLKNLGDRVAYSTITVTLYKPDDSGAIPPEDTFGGRIAEAFSAGWDGFLLLVVGLVRLWPLWLIVALIVVGIRRFTAAHRNRRAAIPPPSAQEPTGSDTGKR